MISFLKYSIILLLVLIDFIVDANANKCSNTEEFTCNNNQCIPISKRCDESKDCTDSSDEEGCDEHHCFEPDWYRCKNNQCVSIAFLCDGEDDCGDYSDEQNCNETKDGAISKPSNCSEGEWKCANRLCIPIQWVCNGESDCLDGSDETDGCTQLKFCDGFRCKDGPCISNEWRCDGKKECKDGSDELQCEHLENCRDGKNNGWFSCKNKQKCILNSQFCDGTKDCTDNSDEPDSCFKCSSEKCSHTCGMKPDGTYECKCPLGYELVNATTCADINECTIYGICDQKCLNTLGSYECFCERQYKLQDDKRTCKVKDAGEAIMIFSSKTEVRGFFLDSKVYFPIAKNLKQAIGVAYDGQHVYWTDIFGGREQIVRSLEDGTHREVVVSVGLGAPEDLAIDWITKNIYFTDAEMQHIGVCTHDGLYCTVIVNHGISKPRSIVLNPVDGEMYWTDWGKHPEIARSFMDGSSDISFVANDIHWPNGLALDLPNSRLYWTDAKLMTLESISLDGTGRRLIFEGIMKHPYGLDVFEDRLYWSDWITRSIESCNKFTGKDHHILLKQKHVYGIHIYHSIQQRNTVNPCELSFCSDICLLTSNHTYACACPQDKILAPDRHSCRVVMKKQLLAIATSNMLYALEYQALGSHKLPVLATTTFNITSLTYSGKNNSLFIADSLSHSIIKLNIDNGYVSHILSITDKEHITAMNYDWLGNNLYWCDDSKGTVEVLDLNTVTRKTLLTDMGGEIPTALSLVPEEGHMFVAIKKHAGVHIDRFRMDGTDRRHVVEQGLLGPLHMIYDIETHRIYWIDSTAGTIESTSVDGDDHHGFKSLQYSPIGIASLSKNLFWISHDSKKLYWTNKQDPDGFNKYIELDIQENSQVQHLVSITPCEVKSHPCQQNNGDCSHLCLVGIDTAVCACPTGMELDEHQKTCIKPKHCSLDEYFCEQTDLCVSKDVLCNGHLDCLMGEDEANCELKNHCPQDDFQCRNTQCIDDDLVCNGHFDCRDKSDEEHCSNKHGNESICHSHQFKCSDGQCLEHYYVCDGYANCEDQSDETQCANATCNTLQFRCNSGACIPKNWECDKEFDCKDMSDEHKQCNYATCISPKFLCSNGLCIDVALTCNKVDDCGDFSDEANCHTEHSAKCQDYEFDCYQNGSLCLPKQVHCNHTVECPNGADEHSCENCFPDQFECKNKKCIPQKWLCDKVNDCGDDSDENGFTCSHVHATIENNSNYTCGSQFQCKNGICISMLLVCNDIADCTDASDEHGVCATACSSSNNPCSQICNKTPSGPQCSCSPGYKLRGDGRTCTDIQECMSEPPPCSQICKEQDSSYECSCYHGYVLKPDKVSCKSTSGSMLLMFATSDGIYQLSVKESTLKLLYPQTDVKITGMDVSAEKGFVYFSAAETGMLYRIHVQHGIAQYMNNIGHPQQLAVDWVTENVYYVDGVESDSIKVCNMDSRYCAKIISINTQAKISALAVDSVNELLFYSVSNWQILNSPNAQIYKAYLDGSGASEIVNAPSNYITGLAYNIHKRTLYYLNQHDGKIHKVNYDGGNQVVIVNNLTKPASLSWFENQLYFYIPPDLMMICPLFGNYQACQEVKLHGHFNQLFSIYDVSRQPNISNICKDTSCSSLCLHVKNTAECLCKSDTIYVAQQQCEIKEVVEFTYGVKEEILKLANEESNSNFKTLAVLLVLAIIFILLSVAAYYYHQQKRSGKLNISMRFQNPVYGHYQEPAQRVILQPGQHEYYNPTCDIPIEKQVEAKIVF